MKLTTFLLFAACMQISAKGLSQQISISERNAPLKKVLKEVARQAGISLVYDEVLLSRLKPVTVELKNATVQEAMSTLLKDQPVAYSIDGKRIIIRQPAPDGRAPADTSITVSGRVTNDAGEAIPGVTVRIAGTSSGTASDASGRYSIRVPGAGASLIFSFLGYNSRTLKVSGNSMDVKLQLSETELTETVVVGYGVQKKSVVTGAISSVRAKDLEDMPITRLEQALQGRTSGVTIAQSSGQPGSGATVRVRGITTFNNNDPLWVVDGVVVDNGGIGYLNQYDIESIEVLKDAASQAIYGARAAAGVILVTTKKGKAGKLTVNYNGYYGTSAPARKLKMLDATQYATLRNEASVAKGDGIVFADPASLGKGTDWQAQIFNNNAQRQNHEISVSGGNEKSTFYTSFGYLQQEGIVASAISKYKRFNIRLNSIHKLTPWLVFGENVGYAYDKNVGLGNTNSEFGGPLSSAINLDPITPVVITDPAVAAAFPYTEPGVRRDAMGRPYGISSDVTQEMTNPLAYITTRLGNYGWSHNIVGNTYLEAEPIKGLKLRSTLGAKIAFWGSESFTPISYLNSSTISSRTSFNRTFNSGYNWNIENTISYTRSIGDHNFTVLAGQGAYMDNRTRNTSVTFNDVPADNFDDASLNFKVPEDKRLTNGGEGADHRIASLFARLNYNYNEKYMLEAIVRRDGSSRFGANNKFGIFPSFSLGWVASREDFWPENQVVTFLKFRGGYGVVGNDNIGDFAFLSTIGSGRNYAIGNSGSYFVGYSPNAPSNPDLKWEETSQANIGFEATVLRNITVAFDWFKKATKDILQNPRIPSYVGAISNPAANVADMENAGVELELGYRNSIGEFDFSLNGNVSYLKNKVTNLGEGIEFLSGGSSFQNMGAITRTAIGQPINSFFGYRTMGIFQTQAEVDAYVGKDGTRIQPNAKAGDFRWEDRNGDGQITPDDRDFIGNPTPKWTYGFTANAAYKGFDIVLFGQGAGGNQIFQGLRRLDIANANWQTKALSRWTGPGTSNDHPRLVTNDPNKNFTNNSEFYLEDGSYLRIKTLQLGYTLPGAVTKRIGLERLRVHVMSENLITFTKYTGYDPEIGGGVFSIDRGIYPQARSFMFGLNATF
ncbi:TonB-dependent receptor [Chitinophaga cymbidii]|uniref:SusC/RagA family TonB-linked outer membrane protein n=1 Tax=Chitinophaga cymbidii TaxID=1096750 RepID=A0A512RNX8_9BACT|nr:TonB-dependent receptor [Chitinophaga cymbidii]GEP97399.1 SusC/RagA family TonB-linked outer membrane protein [Chitinophaga cymbidii]